MEEKNREYDVLWCSSCTFKDAKLQEVLEDKVKALLDGVLLNKSTYAREKAIKTFCEGLRFYESYLLEKEGINYAHLYKYDNQQELFSKLMDIRNRVILQINRQFRHFLVFM